VPSTCCLDVDLVDDVDMTASLSPCMDYGDRRPGSPLFGTRLLAPPTQPGTRLETSFLDELALYRRDVLETLRAPLEDGEVRIARSGGSIRYPCRFTLLAAMNPYCQIRH
jgi:hypothetical protein